MFLCGNIICVDSADDAMAGKDPDKYIGRWHETPCEPINLPFSVESFAQILRAGAQVDGPYSHQQIADWSHSLWWEVSEGSLQEDVSPELRHAAEIALDVDAQWDLLLANTFSLAQLQSMDFSTVRLPVDWFQD
jgi:hypothetical protein